MGENTTTLEELRSIDNAKEASTDLVALNNTVVNMRSSVKAAKVQIIHKLSRTIQKLKAKKGTEDQKVKNLRKAQRLLDEIFAIKEVNADKVSKFALANKTSFAEVCKQPSSSTETRSLARLSEHKALAAKVKAFRQEHPDWQELAAYLHSKQTGRRFKTKQQKLRAAKKGSKFLPDASALLNQGKSGVKSSLGSDQDTEMVEKTEQHEQSGSGDDEDDDDGDVVEESAKVCGGGDDESDQRGRENAAVGSDEEERSSSDSGSEGEGDASEDDSSASSKHNVCEDNSDTGVLHENESLSASDDNGWNSVSLLAPTQSTGNCKNRRKKSNKENVKSDNSESTEEENSDDSNGDEVRNSDGDESAEENDDDGESVKEEASDEYECDEREDSDDSNNKEVKNSDGDESVEENTDTSESEEENGGGDESVEEEDSNEHERDDEETSDENETEDHNKQISSPRQQPKKSTGKNKGNKCNADSDGTAVLTKLPSESNIIKDPFFICGDEAEDDSGISSEEKSCHWIDKTSLGVPERTGGWREGKPWQQQKDDRWLRGDQNDTWHHRDSRGGFRDRGRGRGRGDSWRGRGGISRGRGGRGDSWRSRGGGSNTFRGQGRGLGHGKGHGHDDKPSRGRGGLGQRFGDHPETESVQTDWKKKKAAKEGNISHHSQEVPRKRGRGGFGARGGGQSEMRQSAWKVTSQKNTAKEEDASHPSWEAHRKRKLMEKTAAFSGKRIKFDD